MRKAKTDPGILATLPAVDRVLQSSQLKPLKRSLNGAFLTFCVRKALAKMRRELARSDIQTQPPSRSALLRQAVAEVKRTAAAITGPSLRRGINATGVILHTGLGRAPLPAAALKQIEAQLENYCLLELDHESGKRGERTAHVDEILSFLTGADNAAIVNNNAAAVLLALQTLARKKEVIVSRGQLIEIGGSFRLPDVMRESGALMHEVGTTNKTRLSDYEKAISKKTGAILVAHTSNYRVLGFTEDVSIAELADLARSRGLPLIYDLGGGVFVDLIQYGLPHEPVVSEVVKQGVDLVTFSGDKVLGGPQCGIIVGKADLVHQLKKSPLMRALRCDKLTLAALEATLKIYLKPPEALKEIPALQFLIEPLAEQEARGKHLIRLIKPSKTGIEVRLKEGTSQIGSGALPLAEIPSMVVEIQSQHRSANEIGDWLRSGPIPIISYIKDDRVCLNMRTIRQNELRPIADRLIALF